MKIRTEFSGAETSEEVQKIESSIQQALDKMRPQYVELFQEIDGVISVEEIIGGDEDTAGRCRFPEDVAMKTAYIYDDTDDFSDRVLTEEIVHFLDKHLGFSKNPIFRMQEVANLDAAYPLSMGMLAAVRGGTKGLNHIDDIDFQKVVSIDELMAEMHKDLPFLGVYNKGGNMDKYEWLAELEHAEKTLLGIKDNDHAQILSVRAQRNMELLLMIRFLSNNGLDITKEQRKIERGMGSKKEFRERANKILSGNNAFRSWVEEMANKLDLTHVKADSMPADPMSKITLAMAHAFLMNKEYPLSPEALRKTMIVMFPESYYALQSFRDEVDRELEKRKRENHLESALEEVRVSPENLRRFLTTAHMDEVSLKNLQSEIEETHPDAAKAIESVLGICTLMTSARCLGGPESADTVQEVRSLLKSAWMDASVGGKTIMALAAEKGLYQIAGAIRDASREQIAVTPSSSLG